MNLSVDLSDLSNTELKYTEQLISGLIKKEIASVFSRSTHTVTAVIRNVFKKTEVRNVAELATWYYCKKFHATMIISEGKRKIVTLAMIALVMFAELHSGAVIRASRARRSKNEYEFAI